MLPTNAPTRADISMTTVRVTSLFVLGVS